MYFKLLDCGLRIPPTAGSGSGVSPNPAGYNRVYVHLDGSFDYQQWWKSLKAGQVVVTNGPLLGVQVENDCRATPSTARKAASWNCQSA